MHKFTFRRNVGPFAKGQLQPQTIRSVIITVKEKSDLLTSVLKSGMSYSNPDLSSSMGTNCDVISCDPSSSTTSNHNLQFTLLH